MQILIVNEDEHKLLPESEYFELRVELRAYNW